MRPARRVWIISAGALVLYLVDSLIRHARFRTGYDLTIFDQAINDYAHLRVPDVLVKSQQPFNILGDHFHPILVLLAPFYRLWPDARMLLIAQALLMAFGVHVISRLAVRRLGGFGGFVGAAFALSWGILQAVDFDFHEIAFAVPLLALALEALLDGRFTRVLVFSGLLVLVKEDSPLLVLGIALVLAAGKKYRQAAILGAFGVVSFALIVFVVIPYFSYSHTYTYFAYAGGGSTASHGVGGLVGSAVGTVFSLRGLTFLGALVLTTGLGLRSPIALALLPTLGARLVSNNYAYTGFLYHYNATLMVICFVALLDGIGRERLAGERLPRERHRPGTLAGDGLAAAGPAGAGLAGAGPAGAGPAAAGPAGAGLAGARAQRWLRWQTVLLAGVMAAGVARAPTVPSIAAAFTACSRCAAADVAIADIPDGARVAADVFLMPHLVDRAQVMQAYPGFVDSTGLSLQADWVILDLDSTSYTPGWSRTLLASLLASGRFATYSHSGQYVVLEAAR